MENKKLIITIVCDVHGEETNGQTIAANNLINYLKEEGHTVRVLCADKAEEGKEGYYILPVRNFGIFNGYFKKNGVALAKPIEETMKSAIYGADLVHVILPFKLGRMCAKMAKEAGIPVSSGCHLLADNFSSHFFLNNSYLFNRLVYKHYNKTYKLCDTLHYVSKKMRDIQEKFYVPKNGEVISNGVNDRFRNLPENNFENLDKINILYTGRYCKEKNQLILIKAIKHSKYKDKIQLYLAGTGPYKKLLKNAGKSLPNPPIMKLYSREEMVALMSDVYIYVHAASAEAEGIACMEAITAGVVPIISDSKKTATKEYALTDKSLFKNNNSKDLANKIDWWIEHPEKRAEYSKLYREESNNLFDQNTCMKRLSELLYFTAMERCL